MYDILKMFDAAQQSIINDAKWDKRFLDLSDHISTWSKDPSTKVGSVIVRPNRTVASVGYNGFPRGVNDSDERYNDRPTKYKFVCHAELNAIVTCKEDITGYDLYVSPLFTCSECAKLVIQSGINRVIVRGMDHERWVEQYKVSLEMYEEAGIEVSIIEGEE
jgi:dCMP deaminase